MLLSKYLKKDYISIEKFVVNSIKKTNSPIELLNILFN